MTSPTRTRATLTLEAFLGMPGIDESPSTEFIDGRGVRKMAPQKKHSLLTAFFVGVLNDLAIPSGLGEAFPELRCTYAGRSIVPDVVYLREEHVEVEADGSLGDETPRPPDIHIIEIISSEQGITEADEKLRHSTAHGCSLGWLVHPYRGSIRVDRPDEPPIDLDSDGVLEGDPVLPRFRMTVAEVFNDWMTRRRNRPTGGDPS
ncbi:Uma2 family endonuclease [soil metagenome]